MFLSSPTGLLPIGQSTVTFATVWLADWERACCVFEVKVVQCSADSLK